MPIRRIRASDDFQLSHHQREEDDRADIWSMHYAAWEQDPAALVDSFDRSCHEPSPGRCFMTNPPIPCYDHGRIGEGIPECADFWGDDQPVLG